MTPCMEILPTPQRELWPHLRPIQDLGFVLYGGTAIALYLGHRESVDFDFFSEHPLDQDAIRNALPVMRQAQTLQMRPDSWTALLPAKDGQKGVKVSFFGNIHIGRVGVPEQTDDGVLLLASLQDLMATKLKTILQRIEAKDYRDIASMIDAGHDLAHGLASARLLYGADFQPAESLKALVYFDGGDLHTLKTSEKKTLCNAVKKVRELPDVQRSSIYLSCS